jgi:membrane associated rhomboid family serine protease
VLLVWFIYQALMSVYAGDESSGIAWTSHLIGFASGAIAAAALRGPRDNKDEV